MHKLDWHGDSISDSRFKLRTKLEAALQLFSLTYVKPSLSYDELAVISLVFHTSVSRKKALAWVLKNFTYYRNITLDEFAEAVDGYGPAPPSESKTFKAEFLNAFRRVHLPIIEIAATSQRRTIEYKTTSTDARVYLARFLSRPQFLYPRRLLTASISVSAQPPKGLMDLPPELRLQIYGYIFALPKSGINLFRPSRFSRDVETRVLKRSYEAEATPQEWMDAFASDPRNSRGRFLPSNEHERFLGPRMGDLLSILLVNKAIFEDAMESFYNINTFVFADIEQLYTFLKFIGPKRRECLRHIIFKYNARDERNSGWDNGPLTTSLANGAFEWLAAIKEPEKLHLDIFIYEDDFKKVLKTTTDRGQKYTNILKIPGIKQMETMKGLKRVTFHGDCDTIRQHLATRMIAPPPSKPESKPSKTGKKRKSAAEGESEKGKKKGKKAPAGDESVAGAADHND